MQPFYLFFIPSLASIPQHLHHISHHSSSFAHQSSIITLISPINCSSRNQYVPTMKNEIAVSDQRDCRLLLRKQNDGCTRSKQRTIPVKFHPATLRIPGIPVPAVHSEMLPASKYRRIPEIHQQQDCCIGSSTQRGIARI